MAGAFELWVTHLRPSWMGARAKAIMGGFAAALGDRGVEWARQAILEHMPERASTAGIALIASERQIEPGPSETSTALGSRLVRAMLQWQFAGSPLGVLLALYYSGFTGAVIVQQNGLGYTLTGAPNLDDLVDVTTQPSWYGVTTLGVNVNNGHAWWTIDSNDSFCSRFLVLFPAGCPVDLTVQANIDRLRRVIRRWRPAKATCVSIVNWVSGEMWGWPAGTWGAAGTWGGSIVVYSGAAA